MYKLRGNIKIMILCVSNVEYLYMCLSKNYNFLLAPNFFNPRRP